MKTKLISFIFTIYIVLISGLYFFQEKILFIPKKLPQTYQFNLPNVTEHEILIEKNKISALHLKLKNPKGLVFFLHGNAGNLSTWLTNTSFYEKVNYDLFMIDYPGYGKSTGEIQSEEELYNIVKESWNYIAPQYQDKKIVIYGRSLGTGLAAQLSSETNPHFTILVSPYYNLNEMRKIYYPYVPEFILRYKLDTAKYIKNITNPIIILHGKEDKLIPIDQAQKIYLLNDKIKLIEIQNATHDDIHEFEEYKTGLIEVLGGI